MFGYAFFRYSFIVPVPYNDTDGSVRFDAIVECLFVARLILIRFNLCPNNPNENNNDFYVCRLRAPKIKFQLNEWCLNARMSSICDSIILPNVAVRRACMRAYI